MPDHGKRLEEARCSPSFILKALGLKDREEEGVLAMALVLQVGFGGSTQTKGQRKGAKVKTSINCQSQTRDSVQSGCVCVRACITY